MVKFADHSMQNAYEKAQAHHQALITDRSSHNPYRDGYNSFSNDFPVPPRRGTLDFALWIAGRDMRLKENEERRLASLEREAERVRREVAESRVA